ncbi:MAG: RecX family transcriptional regulator [Bacteroidales bacterium]|nr:RecX family transcriptional regulator [Bacteroidales bacterium]
MDEKQLQVLNRLQAQCARREYCRADIRVKALKALEGDVAGAEAVVASLVADRFVDDLRYAAAFAREKASLTGWGPVKIGYALAAKGIGRETVRQALEEIDGAAADRKMESVLRAKWRTLAEDPEGKLKLLKFGLGRGYEYNALQDLVGRIAKGE